MRVFGSLIFLLLFSLTCTEKQEVQFEPDVEKFFKVYATFLGFSRADSLVLIEKSVLMDSALAQHGMDAIAFDTTLAYFEARPDIFLESFEKFDADMRADQQPLE